MLNLSNGEVFIMSTAKRTLEYLKNNAITQQELAQKLGVSKQYLNQVLNEKRHPIKLLLELEKIID